MADHVLSAEPGTFTVAADAATSAPAPAAAPLDFAAAARGLTASSLILSWRIAEHAQNPPGKETHCTAEVLADRHARLAEAVAQFDAATGRPDAVPAEVAALRTLAGEVAAADRDVLPDYGRRLRKAAEAAKAVTHA